MEVTNLISIPQYFTGKNLLITGGNGFIGKVLVEKFLRSCPKIGIIYLLIRPRKGKSVESRVQDMTNLPVFERLKKENPEVLKKIKVISGEITELQLGISKEDQDILIKEVDVIIHSAASVRFNETLKQAVIKNTRSTRELCRLALRMEKLQVLVYISTTYCHTDRKVTKEKLYPAYEKWETVINLAENYNEHTLEILKEKYMSPLPNSYAFTKSLSEHVVYDLCNGKVPTIIFRPSIVVPTHMEPFPGWIDNFNGPVGGMIAIHSGLLRSFYGDPNHISDYIPVDIIVKQLIIATWQKGITRETEVSFYNGSNNNSKPVTNNDIIKIANIYSCDVPLNKTIWYPNRQVTSIYCIYYYKIIFYNIIPGLLIDSLLKLFGYKPFLMKIHRKIFTIALQTEYYQFNEWEFENDKAMALIDKLLPEDIDSFSYIQNNEFDLVGFFRNAMLGARRYLLNEDDSTIEWAKNNLKRLWIISIIFNTLWYSVIIWILFAKTNVLEMALKKYRDFFLTS